MANYLINQTSLFKSAPGRGGQGNSVQLNPFLPTLFPIYPHGILFLSFAFHPYIRPSLLYLLHFRSCLRHFTIAKHSKIGIIRALASLSLSLSPSFLSLHYPLFLLTPSLPYSLIQILLFFSLGTLSIPTSFQG